MDTATFLEAVLPASGTYVLFIVKGGSRYNSNYSTIAEACKVIEASDKTTATVYFAVGSYADNIEVDQATGKQKVLRTKEKANKFKTLCADLDVGEKYAYTTQLAAATALYNACTALGLPLPLLINSGYGVHAYWVLDTEVDAASWGMLSLALANALTSKGVGYDRSKMHDRSMVLRPTGTHNKKDPAAWKPVTVAKHQEGVSLVEIAKVLAPYKAAAAPMTAKRKRKSAVMDAILSYDSDPLLLDDLRQCKQIDALVLSGGVTDASGGAAEEPLWRASLGIAKFCDDPAAAATALGNQHPGFTIESSMEKMEGWNGTGPTSCAKLEELCPAGCVGCPHAGKFTSPAALARGKTTVSAEVAPAPTATGVESVIPVEYESIPIPGYSRKGGWLLYTAPGAEEATPVVNRDMFVVGAVTNDLQDRQTVSLCVDFGKEGWQVVSIPLIAITRGGNDLSHALALKSVYISGGADRLKVYLMRYLDELRKLHKIEFFCTHYGWQEDGAFLGPTGLIGPNSDRKIHFDGPIRSVENVVTQKGSAVEWTAATAAFAHPQLKPHSSLVLMMMSTILLEGTGIHSLIVNAYSKDSGSGKSVTSMFGLSAWGDPERLKRKVEDTGNSTFKFLGVMRNIPTYIDEITVLEGDALRSLVLTLPEGREKERLSRDAESFRGAAQWRTPVFSSSNHDLYEQLGSRVVSEADKLRVLQMVFDRCDLFDRDAKLGMFLSKVANNNYGSIGPIIAQAVIDRGGAAAVYEKAYAEWESKYEFKFLGKERFYMAIITCMSAMADIVTELGLVKFDAHEAVRNMFQTVLDIRGVLHDDVMDGLDVVQQYLAENVNEMVHMRVRPDASGHDRTHFYDEPQRAAIARTEARLDATGNFVAGLLYINRPAFRKWCKRSGADFNAVLSSLEQAGVGVKGNVRKSLYKGVDGKSASGQSYCLRIDVATHPRLIEAFDTIAPSMETAKPRVEAV